MKDLFSKQAADYAKYRPSYPVALIEYILGFVQEKKLAWDCATGNGQAALLLADHFEKVIATDISEKQLSLAPQRNNIEYRIAKAEQSGIANESIDLITVAQAYHWFNHEMFFLEVKRILKPGGTIAVWGYNIPACGILKIDDLLRHFYVSVIGKYWDSERTFIDAAYSTVPFPFEELPTKNFTIDVEWSKSDLPGYLNSWSSVQHYIKANNNNPVEEFERKLEGIWNNTDKLQFSFPIFLRIGRLPVGSGE